MASVDDEDIEFGEEEDEEEEEEEEDFHARQQGLTDQAVRTVMEQQNPVQGRGAMKGAQATKKRYDTIFSKWLPVTATRMLSNIFALLIDFLPKSFLCRYLWNLRVRIFLTRKSISIGHQAKVPLLWQKQQSVNDFFFISTDW